jgi:alpha-tubulin suppressor-like RCC1 family protein
MQNFTKDKRCFITAVSLCFFLSVSVFPIFAGSVESWSVMNVDSTDFIGSRFTAIAAGGNHSLALKSDGSIVGWGLNEYGEATPPAGNDFIAIAAGASHSLALKSDGSIVAWGYNNYGQATPPDGNDFIAIAAGEGHSLGLKSDGSIVGWGKDNWCQATPPAGHDFIAIAAGVSHLLALKSDGSIIGWGSTTSPPGNDFIAVTAGTGYSLALKSDGSIVGWGSNDYGQATPPDGNDFIAVTAGDRHSLAIKSNGSILCWGDNSYGQATPPDGNDFIAVAAGWRHSIALKSNGSIVGWGSNYSFYGGPWFGQATPPDGNDFIAIVAGAWHCLAIKSDGSIIGWGGNTDWEGTYYGQATPPSGNNFTAIAAGEFHSLALKSDGSIVGWGSNKNTDGTYYCGQATPPDGNDFLNIAAGGCHSLALRKKDICMFNLTGDWNDDCKVDMLDFAIMANNWMVNCFDTPSHPSCVPKSSPAGPIGWWMLDEIEGTSAPDSGSLNNEGALMNGLNFNNDAVEGKIGNALHFDGIDDQVLVSSLYLSSDDGVTIAMWFNPDSTLNSDTGRVDFTYWKNGGGHPSITMLSDGKISFRCYLNEYTSVFKVSTITNSWTAGTWYHIAGTYDGLKLRIYVNGALQNTLYQQGTQRHTSGFYFGNGFSVPFEGKIDDVRVYNRALSGREIADLYNQ